MPSEITQPESTLNSFDALLVVSFGGPEGRDDVIPFLENVLRGRNIPRERMLAVAEHYYHFDGVSPLNGQNRALIEALEDELEKNDIELPIYWGNRNWHPLLPNTIDQMKQDGIQNSLVFVTSAFSSYSGCRQYRENIADACKQVGDGTPEMHKLRVFFNHPGYINPVAENVRNAIAHLDDSHQDSAHILFTAHSIPMTMSEGCDYEKQLLNACGLVMEKVGAQTWDLVYQSRSGRPEQPWLEPDVCDQIQALPDDCKSVVIMPIGFISDHMEVMFDLDEEARQICDELGIEMQRANTVGTHPRFITMIRELIQERLSGHKKLAIGNLGPSHDVCPENCCPLGHTARPLRR